MHHTFKIFLQVFNAFLLCSILSFQLGDAELKAIDLGLYWHLVTSAVVARKYQQ